MARNCAQIKIHHERYRSMKYSKKDTAQRLAYIASRHGVRQMVFSPGSRNAPLVIAFHAIQEIECRVVPDERAAAFIAMGMALTTGETVAIACTSGSAAINYAPAIVEAYHQGIPLLVITADRPEAWIDQGAGQSMDQRNVYNNYIKASYQLPSEPHSPTDLWHIDRMINEALITARAHTPGPVHINVPFHEPLYEHTQDYDFADVKVMRRYASTSGSAIPSVLAEHGLAQTWSTHARKMIVVGQLEPDPLLWDLLRSISEDPSVVILTECTSNVPSDIGIPCIDRFLMSLDKSEIADYYPHLLLTLGQAIISKKLRKFLQEAPDCEHWQITNEIPGKDRYQKLTALLAYQYSIILEEIRSMPAVSSEADYGLSWYDRHQLLESVHVEHLRTIDWCDMCAMHLIFQAIPADGEVHLANSSPVRYAQLFSQKEDVIFRSNRGVSGIDGSSSTAVGAAIAAPDRIVTLLTGDISFFYDSNAYWHHYLPQNLRIILVNNGGGGIFRIIDGPDTTDQLEDYFVTAHKRDARQLCDHHKINYRKCDSSVSTSEGLTWLYEEVDQCALLEMDTQHVMSEKYLKAYFSALYRGSR